MVLKNVYKVEIGAATPEIVIMTHEMDIIIKAILPPCPSNNSVPKAMNNNSDNMKVISDITRNLKYFWLHIAGVDKRELFVGVLLCIF